MSKCRVAVIYGGRSGEHEVSVRSGQAILNALRPEDYEAIPIFITKEGKWEPGPILPEPGANPGIDVVFPVLHGTFGEDGTMQGLLELADLPYVGPGVFASSASMDKEHTKRLCLERGLPVVEYEVLHTGNPHTEIDWDSELARIEARFAYPVFVKPCNLGSSVGISKARDRAGLRTAIEEAAKYDLKVLVERSIVGQEFECSVIGNYRPQASPPCEILPSQEFYDYNDKYVLGTAGTSLTPNVPETVIAEIQRMAVECFRALDCMGMARVDFLLEKASGRLYINEINTIPGFTSISMYPKMWEHAGLPFDMLVDMLLHLAMERHELRTALRYER